MLSKEYIDYEDRYSAHNYNPFPLVISRGRGIWVWDVEGNRYMDCVSAYGAVNQGHLHPKIQKTMIEQAHKLTLVSRAFRNDELSLFCKEVCETTGSDCVLPMNTGVEAVETALKAIRKWGYKKKGIPENEAEIIVCENNFHGRTIAVISFSSIDKFKDGFGPFPDGFKTVPYGDAEAVKQAITEKTAGVLVEPIQGEGGINIPPDGYMKELRKICSEAGVLLAFDEIQSGLGRSGELLTEDKENVKADVSIIGKALSGGFYPVSAVLARGDALEVFSPGEHGSTFGGNPLGAAVSRVALRVLTEEGMVENSRKMGALIKKEIENLKSPVIKQVKGEGLMIGIELTDEAGSAREYCNRLIENGLMCNPSKGQVVRFTPPLIVSEEDVSWAMERLNNVFIKT